MSVNFDLERVVLVSLSQFLFQCIDLTVWCQQGSLSSKKTPGLAGCNFFTDKSLWTSIDEYMRINKGNLQFIWIVNLFLYLNQMLLTVRNYFRAVNSTNLKVQGHWWTRYVYIRWINEEPIFFSDFKSFSVTDMSFLSIPISIFSKIYNLKWSIYIIRSVKSTFFPRTTQ